MKTTLCEKLKEIGKETAKFTAPRTEKILFLNILFFGRVEMEY
jgi:hypothetical protein